MTSSEPEQIRREIEGTQRALGADVDRLTEKVNPSRIVERRVERARGAVTNVKEKIMGSPTHRTPTYQSGYQTDSSTSHVGDRASSAASSAADTLSSAPQAVRQQAQGNPLDAGLIAFGAGWLVASLIPASQKEQEVATQAKDAAREHASAVTGPLGEVANQAKENLREPTQQAVEAVRSTATEAASTVQYEGRSAAQDVSGRAQEAKESVQDYDPGPSGSGRSNPPASPGYERPYGTS